MSRHDDAELIARFNKRLGEIENEIPSPPDIGLAGSRTLIGDRRATARGWIGASVIAAALVALAVVGLQFLPWPDETSSLPAVGESSPSPVVLTPSAVAEPVIPPLPSPGASASSSATPTATLTPAPTAPPSPIPTPAPSAVTSPSLPAASPTAPGVAEWIGPELIAAEHYEEVSLAVDAAGIAHVAAVGMYRDSPDGVTSDGIFYLTNSSGSWTSERVTTPLPGGDDGQPSIAIRPDGSIAIAYARFGGLQCAFGCIPVDPQGIFLVTNRAGSWSDAVPIVEGRVQEPSLQATEGRLHLAYSRGEAVPSDLEYGDEDRTVEYAYDEDDAETWTIETVGAGRSPSLRIGSDGFARIAYRDRDYDPVYAARGGSGFSLDRLPGDWLVYDPLLALDAADEPTIVMFSDQDDPLCGTVSVRGTAGNWSEPSTVFAEDEFCQLRVAGVVTDSNDTVHVISPYNLTNHGVWYANDAGGEFRARQLRGLGGRSISDIPDGDSGIALDGLGRPHILYVVRESRRGVDDGLWYAIGPAE